MKIALDRVSASEDGDYYQVHFEDARGRDDGYVLLQRSFEGPDDLCYLESHVPDVVGHFKVRRARLGRTSLVLDLVGKRRLQVQVAFETTVREYRQVVRILGIMIPSLDLIDECDAC